MKRLMAMAMLACLLAGCVSTAPGNSSGDLPTSSDQTEAQKRARIRLQLAVNYYEQRQSLVALDQIKLALQSDANLADAYSLRALIYMDMGETRLAEENFRHALSLEPNNPEFSNNYGWFLCQSGRAADSIQYFETAVKNRSYQSPAKALNNAGTCTLRLKDPATAERYFMDAFRLEPGNPQVAQNLARVYYERGDYERARFYINRVIKADVMTAEALWLAIKIEHKLGNRDAEISLLTQLRRRHPSSNEFSAYQRGAFDE